MEHFYCACYCFHCIILLLKKKKSFIGADSSTAMGFSHCKLQTSNGTNTIRMISCCHRLWSRLFSSQSKKGFKYITKDNLPMSPQWLFLYDYMSVQYSDQTRAVAASCRLRCCDCDKNLPTHTVYPAKVVKTTSVIVPTTVGVSSTTLCHADTHRLTRWKQHQAH